MMRSTRSTDRRIFLRLVAGASTAALAAACGWDGGNAVRPRLLDISRVNDWVGEKILFSPTRLARTYSPVERSAMLPSYFISSTLPTLANPSAWRLRVDGHVSRTLELTLDELAAMPRVDRKSTRLNSSHLVISYAVFCLEKKK